jgi:phosphoribosylformimino-5-aminoimidazole carboxamide ribotide isomerase
MQAAMLIIPAIDLMDGKAVRLAQGDPERKAVFSDNPAAVAGRWYEQGAERLHVVDLDGAFQGAPRNRRALEAIVQAVPIPVQLGGGIRDLAAVEACLEAGVERVILGTVAVEEPSVVEEACRRWLGRVAVGIDARDGWVAVRGWRESVPIRAEELARRLEGLGIAAIVFTDVNRDGMFTGLNLSSTRRVVRAVGVPVIASGGAASLDDIAALLALNEPGIQGVIVGRALYTGAIDLREAIGLTRGRTQ